MKPPTTYKRFVGLIVNTGINCSSVPQLKLDEDAFRCLICDSRYMSPVFGDVTGTCSPRARSSASASVAALHQHRRRAAPALPARPATIGAN